jgi:hypothetical protein
MDFMLSHVKPSDGPIPITHAAAADVPADAPNETANKAVYLASVPPKKLKGTASSHLPRITHKEENPLKILQPSMLQYQSRIGMERMRLLKILQPSMLQYQSQIVKERLQPIMETINQLPYTMQSSIMQHIMRYHMPPKESRKSKTHAVPHGCNQPQMEINSLAILETTHCRVHQACCVTAIAIRL